MQKTISIILIVIVVLFCKTAICQCTATGFTNGSNFSNDASVGSLSFSNPLNAKLSDNNYAVATSVAVLLSTASTNYLKVTGFNFSLPVSALICGIEVNVVKKAGGINIVDYVNDNNVMLVKNGTVSGNNYASSTHWGSSNITVTYGSPTDLWGNSWAYTDINSSNFGIVFSASLTGTLGLGTSAEIDQIQINVYYDATPLAIELENFSAIKNGQSSFLSWAVNQNNNFENFIVQQSSDLSTWKNIADIKAQKNQQQYLYEDEKLPPGNIYYRLQIMNTDGSESFSPVSMIEQQESEALRIFPNPANDNIYINYKPGTYFINIFDEYGKSMKSASINFGASPAQLSISNLSSGYYFILIDGMTYKFWKK